MAAPLPNLKLAYSETDASRTAFGGTGTGNREFVFGGSSKAQRHVQYAVLAVVLVLGYAWIKRKGSK